jgi:hypothetical protein
VAFPFQEKRKKMEYEETSVFVEYQGENEK